MANELEALHSEVRGFVDLYSSIGGGRLDPYRLDVSGEADPVVGYAIEFACLFSNSLGYGIDDMVRKTGLMKKSAPAAWHEAVQAIAFGYGAWFLASSRDVLCLVSGGFGDQYRSLLRRVAPGAEELIVAPSDLEFSQVCAKCARLLTEAAGRTGVRLKKDSLEITVAAMPAALTGSLAGMKALFGQRDCFAPFSEAVPPSVGRALTQPVIEASTRVSNETVERPPIASRTPTGGDFAQWRSYCAKLANARRIPERLIEDLIPAESQADWHVKNLGEWEAVLEQAMPGRRRWLAQEGVTRSDFDNFWALPAWVQTFLEALSTRHFELEVAGQRQMGEDEDTALMMAVVTVPRFSASPPAEFSEFGPLPFELFDRVGKFWTGLSMDDINELVVAGKLRSANTYLRSLIASGEL